MRKRVILALMLVVALILTTSCSLIVKDPEVDKQTVIVEVNGKTFTKDEVQANVEYQMSYMEYMYSMYGMQYDKTDASAISDAQDAVISSLIQQTVVEDKVSETGADQLTDEELTQLQTTVDTTYQGYMDSVKSSNFADTELTGDELTAAIEAKMTELGYSTKEQLLENEKTTKAQEKLKADVVKDVAVTDEEIQAKYDELLNTAMQKYSSDISSYATDVNSRSTIYYTPAGYRYVKNLLRKFTADDQTKIDDLNTQITDKQQQLTNVESSLTDLGTDTAADTEETAKQRADLTDTQTTLNAEIADLQKQLDAAKEAAYAALQPTVDEILQKLADGGDFDALMTEYGEDTGMQASPAKENGYPVCASSTNLVAPFVEAAMALGAVGDVSPAVRTDFGSHIRKYVSDATEGATPLADVKDEISATVLTEKQDTLYNDTVAQWVTDANAKIYKDRLAD